MRQFRMHRRAQAGDTIVEVLISISVISLVLTGAFLTSRHSSTAVQNSQEHTAAQELLKTQVERVRAAVVAVTTTTPDSQNPSQQTAAFCMTSSTAIVTTTAGCTQSGAQGYQLSDTYDSSTNIFKFTVSWDQLGGGTGTETMYYRIYPGGSINTALALTAPSGGGGASVWTCPDGDGPPGGDGLCHRTIAATPNSCPYGSDVAKRSGRCEYTPAVNCDSLNHNMTYDAWYAQYGHSPSHGVPAYYAAYKGGCINLASTGIAQQYCSGSGQLYVQNPENITVAGTTRHVQLQRGCYSASPAGSSCQWGSLDYTAHSSQLYVCYYSPTYACAQGTIDGTECHITYAPTVSS